jgi:hypothetical protein
MHIIQPNTSTSPYIPIYPSQSSRPAIYPPPSPHPPDLPEPHFSASSRHQILTRSKHLLPLRFVPPTPSVPSHLTSNHFSPASSPRQSASPDSSSWTSLSLSSSGVVLDRGVLPALILSSSGSQVSGKDSVGRAGRCSGPKSCWRRFWVSQWVFSQIWDTERGRSGSEGWSLLREVRKMLTSGVGREMGEPGR